jgi:hypothetical protein
MVVEQSGEAVVVTSAAYFRRSTDSKQAFTFQRYKWAQSINVLSPLATVFMAGGS